MSETEITNPVVKEPEQAQSNPAVISPPTKLPSKDELLAHLQTLEGYFGGFKGQAGHNPFFVLNKLADLRAKVVSSPITSELVKEVKSIEQKPPTIGKK